MRRLLAFLLLSAVVATLWLAAPPPPRATAAEPAMNAAALVVDTGSEVRRICVRFPEAELSGEELLRRASVDPVFAEYSMGRAVCALCGVGCPADDCFCESERSGRYWNYSRGTGTGWQRSSLGASSTTVRDGDVEGWAWGTDGAAPPWSSFDTICVETTSPSPSSPSASPSTPSPSPSAVRSPVPAPSRAASAAPSPSVSAAAGQPPSAPPSATTTPDEDASPLAESEADGDHASTLEVSAPAESGDSGLRGVLGFAGAAGVLGAGFVAARRRRG